MKRVLSLLLMLCLAMSNIALAETVTLPAGTSDLGTIEPEALPDGDTYYQQLLEAEKYNYRVLRNIPTAFDAEEYAQYIALAEKAIRGNRLGDKQRGLLDDTLALRQGMKRLRTREDAMWMLWGNSIPQKPRSFELDFTDCYDNSDFAPFLLPWLLEDQSAVKGNLIIVAGGGYSGRNNKTEGYPIAEAFTALGYNCYVLQRRVTPYDMKDTWMDMQRAIRLVRRQIDVLGLGGGDCIIGAGFSGGSATVLGCVANCYGAKQPNEVDAAYVADDIDTISSDLDVALCIYGPNYLGSQPYKGLVTDNENLPAMFLVAGLADNTGAQNDNLILAESVKDKTMVEYHAFANTPHGFGVGTPGTNSPYWIPMADGFIDQAMAAKRAGQ